MQKVFFQKKLRFRTSFPFPILDPVLKIQESIHKTVDLRMKNEKTFITFLFFFWFFKTFFKAKRGSDLDLGQKKLKNSLSSTFVRFEACGYGLAMLAEYELRG